MPTTITLTVNPAIDVSTSVHSFVPFSKLRGTPPHREPGGGDVNVARVIKRLGGDVAAIYPAGGTMGQLLRLLIEREGVTSFAIEAEAETRENFTVVETSSGMQYRFVLPGAALHEHEWRGCLDALSSLPSTPSFVVASGSLPSSVPDDFYGRVAKLATARGARIAIDASGPPLVAALEQGVDLIKPNLREFQELTGSVSDDEDHWIEAGRRLIAQGRTRLIALSLGEDGALLISRDETLRAKSLAINAVSVVGAGDSFLAGLVWRLVVSSDLADALRYAMAAGTAAILNPGTSLSKREDVLRLYNEVEVFRITASAAGTTRRQAQRV